MGADDHGTSTTTTTTAAVGSCCLARTGTSRGHAQPPQERVLSALACVGEVDQLFPPPRQDWLWASLFIGRYWEGDWVQAGLSLPFFGPLPCRPNFGARLHPPPLAPARVIGNGLVPICAPGSSPEGFGPCLHSRPPLYPSVFLLRAPRSLLPLPLGSLSPSLLLRRRWFCPRTRPQPAGSEFRRACAPCSLYVSLSFLSLTPWSSRPSEYLCMRLLYCRSGTMQTRSGTLRGLSVAPLASAPLLRPRPSSGLPAPAA
jgi:hypothetical protein